MSYPSILCLFFLLLMNCAHQPIQAKSQQQKRNSLIKEGQNLIGINYQFAGRNPQSGFDCSGFIEYIFGKIGIKVTGSAKDISRMGKTIRWQDSKAGDLIFFGKTQKEIDHVGMVVINTAHQLVMIHSSSQIGISEVNILTSPYWNSRLLFSKSIID